MTYEHNKALREKTRVYLDARRAEFTCSVCGAQPVQFHHPGENGGTDSWVWRAVMDFWSPIRIDAEIAQCIPLCNTHHREEHARLRWKAGFRPLRIRSATQAKLQRESVQW